VEQGLVVRGGGGVVTGRIKTSQAWSKWVGSKPATPAIQTLEKGVGKSCRVDDFEGVMG